MVTPKAIICVGNRLMPDDNLGPLVYDYLVDSVLPSDVTLIDGGLRGLDLLADLEGRRRVVFADALDADQSPGPVVLDGYEVAASAWGFGHSAGLPYLLGALPYGVTAPPASVVVGAPAPAGAAMVGRVARQCLALVDHDST